MSKCKPIMSPAQAEFQDALENLHRMTEDLETLIRRLVPVVDELEKVPDQSQKLIEQLFQHLTSIQNLQGQTCVSLKDVHTQLTKLTERLKNVEDQQKSRDQQLTDLIRVTEDRDATRARLESRMEAMIAVLEQTVNPGSL